MRAVHSQIKGTANHAGNLFNMGKLTEKPDAQKDLGVIILNIVKINNLISVASSKRGYEEATDCPQSDLIFSPGYAHTIVDANAHCEESCLSDSDIDLLMLIGEGLSRNQITSELGWDRSQISKWKDEIIRKARLQQAI